MGGAAPGMQASSAHALQGAEATMDRPARPQRDGDATLQDEAVADLLHLLEPPAAVPGMASMAHGVVRDAGEGAAQPPRRRQADAFIGGLALPIGVAGPLRVHGQHAHGDYRVPLATTDAALVAAYTRGARLVTEAGGCNALLLDARISGAPGFAFDGAHEARAPMPYNGQRKRVAAEVTLAAALVRREWDVEPQTLCNYWRMAAIGGALTGTIGVQGQYAGGLAALYLACGQDMARIAESAIGVTRLELDAHGDLYAAVTMPHVNLGGAGAPRVLPSQWACLRGLGLAGPGHTDALAEICAALALAGELATIGSICAGRLGAAQRARR